MQHLSLEVEGMTCMGCVMSVKRLLSALDGVEEVDIDLTSGRVRVGIEPARVQPGAIRQAIEVGGFKVVSTKEV